MSRGDIVLIGVPYVGSAGAKVRPAVVVQNDVLNMAINETIIAAVTSNLAHIHQPHQLFIDLSRPEGRATGLVSHSAVRCDRLHAVPQADVRKVIGKLPPVLMTQLDLCLKSALGIS